MSDLASLKDAITRGSVIVVAGTGVSKAISGLADEADWIGLIRSGIQTVEALSGSDTWSTHAQDNLEYAISNDDTAELINVASGVQTKLQQIGHQAYADWLRGTVGDLNVVDPAVGEAIDALTCPILTTNYDELIEKSTGRRSAVWTDIEALRDVMRNDPAGVVHVHGIWDQPDSVVLSDADYTRILGSEPAQHLQSAYYATKSFVFIGYGSGLEDPNFGRMLDVHKRLFPATRHAHFRLVREDEVSSARSRHADDNIRVVSYGNAHADLGPFLRSLASGKNLAVDRDYVSFATEAIREQLRGETILGSEVNSTGSEDIDQLAVPPVLLPMPHDQFTSLKHDKTIRPSVHDLDAVCDGRRIYLVAGEEGSGVTTAIRWLVARAANRRAGVAPLYIDSRRFRGTAHAMDKEVRTEAIARRLIDGRKDELPAYVLAVDNVIPTQSNSYESMLEDLKSSGAESAFIGVRQGVENEIYEALTGASLDVEVLYLGKPGRTQAQELARLIAPDAAVGIVDQVFEIIQREHLQRTPFNIILLLVLLSQGAGSMTNASDTAVLDKYVQLLLGRNGSFLDPRWTLDPQNREVVLSHLAMRMVQSRTGSLTQAATVQHLSEFFTTVDWSEDPVATMQSLAKMRLLRITGDRVSFQQSGYFHLFAAKAAQANERFLDEILAEPLFFGPIIRHYAALVRNSERVTNDLLAALQENWASRAPESAGYAGIATRPAPELPPMPLPHPDEDFVDEDDDQQPQDYDDSDDRDAEPLPLDDPSQWPLPQQLTWALDLASRVVRDSDQIRNLNLKDQLLVVVLDRWGFLLDLLIQDGAFDEVADAFIDAAVSDGQLESDKEEDFRHDLRLSMPSYYVLAGLMTTLASRKLLLALERVTSQHEENAVYVDVTSALLALVTNEAGWASRLPALADNHGRTWVVSRFVYPLVRQIYRYQRFAPEDQDNAEEFFRTILEKRFNWPSDREKKTWLAENLHLIRQDRLQNTRHRLEEGELAIDALGDNTGEDDD